MKRLWTYTKHKRSDPVGITQAWKYMFLTSSWKGILVEQTVPVSIPCSEYVTWGDFSSNYQMPTEDCQYPVIDDINFTLNGIIKVLSEWNPNKSPGLTIYDLKYWRSLQKKIAAILLTIFRKSLETGEVIGDCRKSNFTPLYKKGQTYLAENHRPLALTSVCWSMKHGESTKVNIKV